MATDRTGALTTNVGIQKYNVDNDAPSGLGFNGAMDDIDALLGARTKALTATGDLLYASAANTPARLPVGSTGNVLTVAGGIPSWAAPAAASGELSYDEFTAPVSGIAGGSPAAATTIKTSASVAYDGSTAVVIEFFAPQAVNSVDASNVFFELFEDATDLGLLGEVTAGGAAGGSPIRVARRRTPSAASHTYTVKAYVSGGSGTVQAGTGTAGVFLPGFIRITKA